MDSKHDTTLDLTPRERVQNAVTVLLFCHLKQLVVQDTITKVWTFSTTTLSYYKLSIIFFQRSSQASKFYLISVWDVTTLTALTKDAGLRTKEARVKSRVKVDHTAGALPGFWNMKQTEVSITTPPWMVCWSIARSSPAECHKNSNDPRMF